MFYQRSLNVSCHSSSPLSVSLTFTRLLLIQSDTRHTHGEADAPTCLSSATFLCLLPHKFTAGRLQQTAQSALAGDPVWESLRTTSQPALLHHLYVTLVSRKHKIYLFYFFCAGSRNVNLGFRTWIPSEISQQF